MEMTETRQTHCAFCGDLLGKASYATGPAACRKEACVSQQRAAIYRGIKVITHCCNCGRELTHKRIGKDRAYCSHPKCRAALAKALYYERYKVKPKINQCSECGDNVRFYRGNITGKVFCQKKKCQSAYRYQYYRIARAKNLSAKTGVVPIGERDIYKPIVKLRMTQSCEGCSFVPHCQKRVQLGAHVACESADDKDKRRYAVSEYRKQIQELLVEGLSI